MSGMSKAIQFPPGVEERWLKSGFWTDETPQEWLAQWAKERPDAPAVIAPDKTLTYRELYEYADRFAGGLLKAGFRKGDVIAVQLPNLPEFLVAYHGINRMGGMICLLHMPYRKGELEPLLRHSEARGVICFSGIPKYDAPGTMLELAGRLPALEKVIVVGKSNSKEVIPYSEFAAGPAGEVSDPPGPSDPAVLAFTSGTSASPKAVAHSYRTMCSSHRYLVVDCDLRPDDVVMSAPPFTHIYGLCVANITLRTGAASALLPLYRPDQFAETIERARVTVMFCGPAHALATMTAGLMVKHDMSSLRRIVYAGSACPPELVDSTEKTCPNATVYQMWGMTEVLMSFVNPVDTPLEVRRHSIGTKAAGHEIRAVKDTGEVAGPGEEGELQIRGPFVFTGYYNNPEANRGAFTDDGWFRTGDLVTIDRDGNVVMTGRVKDIINRGGIKINPVDVEGLIDEHPAVLQSAIVPMPDEILGEKACLFVVPKPGASVTLDEIFDYLKRRNVAKLKWPERLEIVDDMPMTPTRKIIKGELAKRLG